MKNTLGTWRIPSNDGEPFVLASLVYSWAVNNKSKRIEHAKKLVFALGEPDVAIQYARRLGNIPARLDAKNHPDFALMSTTENSEDLLLNAKVVPVTVGANAVVSGVARATEGLLIGRFTAQEAQSFLYDYVKSVLGEKFVVEKKQ